MTNHRSLARAAAVGVAGLLLVTGCSKSSKSASTTTTKPASTAVTTTTAPAATTSAAPDASTTTPPADATTSTTPAADPAAAAKVKAVNLVAGDLPAGWTSTPSTSSGGTAFDTCAADLNLKAHTVAKADSAEFDLTKGQGQLSLQTTTGQLDTTATAQAFTAKLGDQSFVDCATKAFLAKLGSQATGQLAIDNQVPQAGDEVRAVQGQFTVTQGGQKITLLAELVAVRTGSLVTTVSATAVGMLPDSAVLTNVVTKVAARQKG